MLLKLSTALICLSQPIRQTYCLPYTLSGRKSTVNHDLALIHLRDGAGDQLARLLIKRARALRSFLIVHGGYPKTEALIAQVRRRAAAES